MVAHRIWTSITRDQVLIRFFQVALAKSFGLCEPWFICDKKLCEMRLVFFSASQGFSFFLKPCESESLSVMFDSLWSRGLSSPWSSLGQNTGVGSLSLLQRIFSTQGSNPGLPRCRRILYQLSRKGSPGILEWVAFPFSRGSSQARDRTQISHIAGRFFTS